MTGLARFIAAILEILQVALEVFLEVSFDRLSERRLVVFEADHEIATALDDVVRDLFLAAHGVDRDQESVRSICSKSWGIAVISLDFSSVATWPKAIPSSLAQALTMCSGPRSCDASWDRRFVLPSMAISRSGCCRRSGSRQ